MNRDPRFDDLSGEYNEVHFNKNYDFLSDIRKREKQVAAVCQQFYVISHLYFPSVVEIPKTNIEILPY